MHTRSHLLKPLRRHAFEVSAQRMRAPVIEARRRGNSLLDITDFYTTLRLGTAGMPEPGRKCLSQPKRKGVLAQAISLHGAL